MARFNKLTGLVHVPIRCTLLFARFQYVPTQIFSKRNKKMLFFFIF